MAYGYNIRARSGRLGFSLLEVLVVLVIIGLVSTVLVQALTQVLEIRSRLAPFIDRSEDVSKVGVWYRSVVSGIVPDLKDGPNVFQGSTQQISGLTLAPLGGDIGIPVSFRLAFENDADGDILLKSYTENDAPIILARWTRSQDQTLVPGFLFLNESTWVDHWPLSDAEQRLFRGSGRLTNEDPRQLPALIRANVSFGEQQVVLVAAPRGFHTPPPRVMDLLNAMTRRR